MEVIGEVVGVAQNGISPALLVQGYGNFVKFPGSKLAAHAPGQRSPRWTQRAHLVVLDLSHQHVEDTLLALVSKGGVSMGLSLKAR